MRCATAVLSFVLCACLAFTTRAQTLRYVGAVERSELVPLGGAHGVAIAPDGTELFSVAFDDNALVVWGRNPRNSALVFAQAFVDGADGVSGLFRPVRVAVAPDGLGVYVGAFFGDSLAAFRKSDGGALSFVGSWTGGAGGVFGLTQVRDLAFSPDGRFLYVASYGDNAVLVLEREARSGQVNPLQVLFDADEGGSVPGLVRPSAIAVSADGAQVYTVCSGAQSLVAFTRSEESGAIEHLATFLQGENGVSGLAAVEVVATSPDGLDVYAAGADGIAHFQRRAGLLDFAGRTGEGAVGEPEVSGPSDLVFTPQGRVAFLSRAGDDALVVLRRDPGSGELRVAEMYQAATQGYRGLRGASSLSVSADGRWLYVAGQFDDAVGIFRREPSCLGDCNEDDQVTVDELVRAVALALTDRPDLDCWAVDRDADGQVTVDEIVAAVQRALLGCTL